MEDGTRERSMARAQSGHHQSTYGICAMPTVGYGERVEFGEAKRSFSIFLRAELAARLFHR